MISPSDLRERIESLSTDLDGREVSLWIATPVGWKLTVMADGDGLWLSEIGLMNTYYQDLGAGDGPAEAIVAEHGCQLLPVNESRWICRLVAPDESLASAIQQIEAAIKAVFDSRPEATPIDEASPALEPHYHGRLSRYGRGPRRCRAGG
jgi:hypothetical protein